MSLSIRGIHVLIAGDLYPSHHVGKALRNENNIHNLWKEFEEEISFHDVSIVNLEAPLTLATNPIEKNGPVLKAHPACAVGIASGGFSVVSLANNHILDMGEQGVIDTMVACKTNGLECVGAGENIESALMPLIITVNDLRLCIISICENEFSIATDSTAGACPIDLALNYYQIEQAKTIADFILVIFHGGNEYYPLPSPEMVKRCRFLIDVGAHAVVCSHSHTPSGFEYYKNKVIVYGLGNFLFSSPSEQPISWYRGYFASIHFDSKEIRLKIIPYEQSRKQSGVYKLPDKDVDNFLQNINKISQIITNSHELQKRWQEFCASRQSDYLAWLFSLSRLERLVFKRLRIWPFWRVGNSSFLVLKNIILCEAHRDILVEIFSSVKKKVTRQ